MKKFSIFIFFICLMIAIKLDAKQWTVSNNPNMPAQFSSVQTAIDSAAAGDTIFVYNSPNQYGSVNVTKKLHIIGAGYWGVWVSGRERTSLSPITILADSVMIEGIHGNLTLGSINPI
jgi:hypothetical protein